MRLVIHPGFGKCASSSIQSTLSLNPIINLDHSRRLHYFCLAKNEVIRGEQITQRAARSPYKYCSSANASFLLKNNRDTSIELIKALEALGSDDICVMSCEGWITELESLAKLNFISDLKELCTFIVLVRPPISWINSAYWQWGAWTKADQHDWIMSAGIEGSRWVKQLRRIKQLFPLAKLKVIPMTKEQDAARIFFEEIGLNSSLLDKLEIIRNNVSLPLDIIHLYHRFPELRPSPHEPLVDFLIANTLSSNTRQMMKGPVWAMTDQESIHIHEALSTANEALVQEFLDPEKAERVLQDSKWTTTSSYVGMPYTSSAKLRITPAFGSKPVESMIRDLLISLSGAS